VYKKQLPTCLSILHWKTAKRNILPRGLEGLFSVDDEGYVQSKFLPRGPSGRNTRQKMMQLFWTTRKGRELLREGLCQLATVSSLVLNTAGLKIRSLWDPVEREFGKLAYGVDILIRFTERNMIICGELSGTGLSFTNWFPDSVTAVSLALMEKLNAASAGVLPSNLIIFSLRFRERKFVSS
jgi:hypothetical protein